MGEIAKSTELIERLTTTAIISDVIGIIVWAVLSAVAMLFIVQIGKSGTYDKYTLWRSCSNDLTGIAIFALVLATFTIIISLITTIVNTIDIIRWVNVPDIQVEGVDWGLRH